MTTHVPMARVPFAPLDNQRLQHLASAKNRQNGMLLPWRRVVQKPLAYPFREGVIAHKSTSMNAKNGMMKCSTISMTTSNKRAHEPSTYDDFGSENIDPAMFDSPSKKTKGNTFDKPAMKPFTSSLSTSTSIHNSQARNSMPPPSSTFSSSPRSFATPLLANIAVPRAPMTAPAGRSPKKKFAALKSTRRTSAPFSRIDPPSFSSTSTSALPFSLDAALSGSSTPASHVPAPKMADATIAESMPKNWFFEIYQDTPEEEAANLMEHSTLTLDLSSDEEDGKKADDYRGKENTPPEGYDAPTASSSSSPTAAVLVLASKKDIVRQKVVKDEMDDGSRSPLSDLETEDFYSDGLTKNSFVFVDEIAEKAAVSFIDIKDMFPAAQKEVAEKDDEIITCENDEVVSCEKDEIVVWQDKEEV